MRHVLLLAAFCLNLGLPIVRAQSSHKFALSEIDGAMVKQFKTAWQQSGLGIKDIEAVVMIMRESDGSAKAVLGPSTNQVYRSTFIWNPAIVAVVHTHPNDRDPRPR